eukprot:scaffold4353_cov217-Pinguiococcus_pyrenoidosus.AAC.4
MGSLGRRVRHCKAVLQGEWCRVRGKGSNEGGVWSSELIMLEDARTAVFEKARRDADERVQST